jgi:NAD-dependent deacetylase
VHVEPVVEVRRLEIADVRLDRHRLDPVLAQRVVATAEPVEVANARDLEPDEVLGVVGDSLRVRFGEADTDLGVEVEAVDGETLRMGIERLAELVRDRGPAVVLTGAGISTESGIPDFRSPTGVWAQYDPEEYATLQAFQADPVKVWSFYSLRYRALTEAQPNAGHEALAELERRGHVRAVVTQNIDTLHQRAGSRDVVEVHGSIRTCSCPSCGQRYSLREVLDLLERDGMAPRCEDDGSVLKPDVVFFGELLPQVAIDRAYELARTTGLMLVVGSQLEVWPVSQLPTETMASGGEVAIVNRGRTSFDARAAVKVDGSAGETLAALAREVS